MLKSLVMLALWGTLLFGWPCVAENQQSKPHAQQNQPGQTQQPVPPTHVVIDPSSATVHIKPEPDDSKKAPPEKTWKQFLRPEWVIVYITAIYVVISGLTLWAIKRQADIMETQAKDARESAAQNFEVLKEQTDNLLISAKAATVSAIAADENAKAANAQIEMVKNKERAKISVSIKYDEFQISSAYSFDPIPIEITNDGATSAFSVRAKAEIMGQPGDGKPYVGNFIPLTVPDVIRANNDPIQAQVILVQDINFYGFESSPIPYYFHLAGIVEYKDIFGENHTTTFRFRFQVSVIQPILESKSVLVKSFYGWKRFGATEENTTD